MTLTNTRRRRRTTLRRISAFLAAVMLCMTVGVIGAGASAPVAFPENAVKTRVYLDGEEILPEECIILDQITYVPLRRFAMLFDDYTLTWNGSTSTATVKSGTLTMTVQANAAYITANGHVYYTVGRVRNLGGHLYVPIRPLVRAFNSELTWNAEERAVEISTENRRTPAVAYASYKQDDLYWLARIISSEARGESLEGQIAVGNVVLNRVRHRDYPNTIYGVIFDRKHGTQFSPVAMGTIYQAPTASAIRAAKICLEGYTLSEDILFFMNPRIATNNWIALNRPHAFTIGNHAFYK